MFSPDRQKAIELFAAFTNNQNDDKCLDYDEKIRVSDIEIRAILSQHSVSNINQLLQLKKHKRDEIIKAIKSIDGATVRQLSRITGISKSTIDRI